MCIRDRRRAGGRAPAAQGGCGDGDAGDAGDLIQSGLRWRCLLYTSDAADDLLCVDLGGRRNIKKKNALNQACTTNNQ